MVTLLWDASALAKHYTPEVGTPTVEALFAEVPLTAMVTTIWSYAETFSILLRRHNSGAIGQPAFTRAASALENDFIYTRAPRVLTIDDSAVLAGISLMKKHNVNTTDAAILEIFLRYVRASGAPSCVLVAADTRLVRAAGMEGLSTIEPQSLSAVDVRAFLATL